MKSSKNRLPRKLKKEVKKLENKLRLLIEEQGITKFSPFIAPDKKTTIKQVLQDCIYMLEIMNREDSVPSHRFE